MYNCNLIIHKWNMRIAVVTDSGSGINPNDIKDKNLFVISMSFMINEDEYYENYNITEDEFYTKIKDKDVKLSTSQPSLFRVSEVWKKLLEDFDAIIHIPLSSGLSASCGQAMNLAESEYEGRVFVVDNARISATQRAAVDDALNMIKDGYTPEQICYYLYETRLDSSIYISVDTLTYLKKGGRVTPQAAALGNLLRIKPILQIQGGKLDAYKKVMSNTLARKTLIEAVEEDLKGRFKEYLDRGEIKLGIAHTNFLEGAQLLKEAMQNKFPNLEISYVDSLSCLIACHTGPKALGIGCFRTYKPKTK